LLLLIAIAFVYIGVAIILPTLSVDTTSSVWDGTTATSFASGTGTQADPYQISSGSELAYLFNTVLTDANYNTKYYKLTNNIDMNGNDFSRTTVDTANFSGIIDGQGYSIFNFTINNYNTNTTDNVKQYSLIPYLLNGTIKNINFYNVTMNVANIDATTEIGFLSTRMSNSTLENVSAYNITLNVTTITDGMSYTIGGLVDRDLGSNTLHNVNIDFTSSITTNADSLFNVYNSSTINNVMVQNNGLPIGVTNTNSDTLYPYTITNNSILLTDGYSNDAILESINNGQSYYQWTIDSNEFKIQKYQAQQYASNDLILLHASGISGNTVYVNDKDADTNYYTGLNYTYNTGTLPTETNKNLYGTTNLVTVEMTYSSTDVRNTYTGYVSISEQQSKYVYDKVYVVNTNGTSSTTDDYVDVELIDNPFQNRPTDMGFNGWVTNYRGAKVSFSKDYYSRYVRIPVSYNGDTPASIAITMNASWVLAKKSTLSSTSGSWSSSFADLDTYGLHELTDTVVYAPYSMAGYYHQATANYYSRYTGYDEYGDYYSNTRCYTSGGCTYYTYISNENYIEGVTYYQLNYGYMEAVDPTTLDLQVQSTTPNPAKTGNMAGFYEKILVPYGNTLVGYYNADGTAVTSGTCYTSSGCSTYKLIQYYSSTGSEETYNANKKYYYLADRDTNIIVLNRTMTSTWSSSEDKPFTLTSMDNGTDYRSSYYFDVRNLSVWCYNDTTIENVRIYTTTSLAGGDNVVPASGNNNYRYLYGNFQNVKVGRGITRNSNYQNFYAFIAGSNGYTGSSDSPTKYRDIIESGYYNAGSVTNGSISSGGTIYVLAKGIYGNDYDRVNNNNNNLIIQACLSGTWGGYIYSSDDNTPATDCTYKSGQYGASKSSNTQGIYVGGRQYGTTYASRRGVVEGGWVYVINGGPITDSSRANLNDTYLYIKGGEINSVFGGAGRSATYGNRIVQMTGGLIDYSLFGGSNASAGSDGDGTVKGTSYVYVGGNATIGLTANVTGNKTLWNAEAGSVFGNGDGRSGYSTIGSNDNAIVIIDGNANILRNVYGGGNYGATGVSSDSNTTYTNIHVLGGTIAGSVYGGGNNNGSGSSDKTSTININMTSGTVTGSVYGGSRTLGTIYGSTNVNVQGGNVTTDVYGGGEGGYTSTSSVGTFVTTNAIVNIGTTTTSPNITGDVYGGSAYGTVNGASISSTANSNDTKVTVYNGTITGSVYGAGKGSTTLTPYVKGNITVNINGGTMTSVYGGFNQAGVLGGTDYVYLNGGVAGTAFGAGNNVGLTTTNIYLQGGTVTTLYGGANQSGAVTTANVTTTSGTVTDVYGGNNVGGTCTTTNVKIDGSTINGSIYGGGNQVDTTTTNIDAIKANNTISYIYGGGNQAGATTTNVNLKGITATNVFGGSNQSGTVATSNVTDDSGNFTSIYGGNNNGGTTTNSHVTINNSGTLTNLYGGGNKANTVTSNVIVNDGVITTAFGGGNEADTTTTNIRVNKGTITDIYGGGNAAGATTTNVDLVGGTITNAFGGSNQSGNVTTSNLNTYSSTNALAITNVYGGNNAGGVTSTTNVNINSGTIQSVFGGGNNAVVGATNVVVNNGNINNIFGGGNNAGVTGNTNLKITGGTTNVNAYGGGNEGTVSGNTTVLMNNGTITGSIYAGGNGSTAIVSGNTNITIAGTSVIGYSGCTIPDHGSVFGGGNAAATGTNVSNNSVATVNIAGGTMYGSVYGGANTSVVYGTTNLNIGAGVATSTNVTKGPIAITGTVFGGGEANASGSDTYDYSFISVTNGITVNIDANNYSTFTIGGSIFGSGDASSTTGTSIINISNYGTYDNPKKNVSIQRANKLTNDNSAIDLKGATDRTNEYSNVLFTLSIIDELDLKNNSTLYLQTGSNLLKKFKSITSTGDLATVTIDSTTKTVTKNVDNRLYMYEGKNLNIATNESVTSYGEVYGMTFFGMYKYKADGSINHLIYSKHDYGDTLSWADMASKGSYVLGLHKTNHNIQVDGFYSNFMDSDTTTNKIDYITPTPESSNFYMWIIGEVVSEYNVNLTASKYSTLGAVELSLLDFAKANTTFEILGFDYSSIATGITLVPTTDIPRIASSTNVADTTMGLTMKTSNTGWLTNGTTSFLTQESNNIVGTKQYVGENSTNVPTLLFYLYHSKNLGTAGDMGTVTISLMAITKVDDLTNETKRLNINVNLSRALYTTNDYEAGITAGRQYSMFASTVTNITSKSAFSTYYSLYTEGNSIYRTGYHRALISNYVLPLNTKITMIDLSSNTAKYYYHTITASDVTTATTQLATEGDISYDFSMFETMGALNSGVYYDDAAMNTAYYNSTSRVSSEEFIFIVDFADASITTDSLNNSLLIELQDQNNETMYSVLGIEQQSMLYNLYANKDAVIDINGTGSVSTLYNGKSETLNVTTTYTQSKVGSNTIYDTRYFDSKLGIKISLINSSGAVVTGTSLMGLYYEINGVKYYPNIDGTTRIKIADKVGNVQDWIKFDTSNANIPTGQYKIRIESFGSPDGIYYGLTSSDYVDIPVYIINEIYGLDITTADTSLLIDATTGKNMAGDTSNVYNINYNSGLANPNIHMRLYRRDYDIVYDTTYTLVDLKDYVTNNLEQTTTDKEYLVVDNPNTTTSVGFSMKTNLMSGTYKLQFILYDGTTAIGTVDKYIIIK